nr:retrovirus-related Pol polyprotein from transposon TNT 1-94 [Tanacetum cinerariifolium]
MKGIKREFSVARTLQQNRVAKRKNRTLIKAARTVLVDSLLPTIFWAKAVNTACYVQNRVLVIRPHNKTPYELLLGRSPNIDFIKPFGCSVTILNTLDHLGKFEGKVDEGFLVGYSVNSKAFRKNQTNHDVGVEIHDNGQARQEKASDHEYNCFYSRLQVHRTQMIRMMMRYQAKEMKVLNINIVGSHDPSVPSLEETGILDDVYNDREVGAEADTNNLELSTIISIFPCKCIFFVLFQSNFPLLLPCDFRLDISPSISCVFVEITYPSIGIKSHGVDCSDLELALEKEVKELNNIVFKRNRSAQTVHMLTKPQVFYNHATRQALGFQNPRYLKKAQQLKPNLYDGSIIGKSDVIVVPDSENTLLHAEESADNRPPMLEKDMYDSWKSRMELYMLNRPHGRMILESVEQGPLIWPYVEVEGVTRLKKYLKLSVAEAI